MSGDAETRFDPDTIMHHGTAAPAFESFHSHLPNFFTSEPAYARIYMNKGPGRPRIIAARLDVENPFMGLSEDDMTFYNDDFVPWMHANRPSLARGLKEMSRQRGAPFEWVDDLFVHLRRTARSGTSRYDGIVVDEKGTGLAVGGHGMTVVPLWTSQIRIIGN